MKKEINITDYAGHILSVLPKGVLLTTKVNDKVNSMTIGWGTIGYDWSKPVFIAFVRKHRFTKKQLSENDEFTINIPLENNERVRKILGVCGTKSGRDIDKVKELDLHLEEGECVSVPAVKELPLTLECKVIYKQKQKFEKMTQENFERYYPQNVDGYNTGANQDTHVAYYGQILKAYIVE